MTVRFLAQRSLQLDDFFLIFACICLTGAIAIVQWGISVIYQMAQLSLEPPKPDSPTDLFRLIGRYQKIIFAFVTLSWAAIFAAKFSYLFFFRHLIHRIRPLVIYWRVVITFTIMAAILSMLQNFIACILVDSQACGFSSSSADSTLTDAAVKCGQGFGFTRALRTGICMMTLDVVTDLMSRDLLPDQCFDG